MKRGAIETTFVYILYISSTYVTYILIAHSTPSVGIPDLGWLYFSVEDPIRFTECNYDLIYGVSEDAIVKSSPIYINTIYSSSSSLYTGIYPAMSILLSSWIAINYNLNGLSFIKHVLP